MISEIHLRHFKCFEKLDLPLGKLTLLTGVNAGGKSSVIQALLVLKQAQLARGSIREFLPLNGPEVELGTVGDTVDELTARESFQVGLNVHGEKLLITCSIGQKDDLFAQIQSCRKSLDGQIEDYPSWIVNVITKPELQLMTLIHVSTERIGPRETYAADVSQVSRLGAKGEFTAWFLHANQDANVPESLCQPSAPPKLLRQVEAWLAIFFPGAGLEVKRVEGTNLVTLRIRTSTGGNFHRPQNVGYGLTHILPVITGALATAPGGTFIVENPETHLHPSAQALMGRFLTRVAAAGRQVIIESHSDHILNGLRLAVKNRILAAEDVQIHFFNRRDTGKATTPQVITPCLNKDGRIDHWPKGFFDQFEEDLDALTSWD